MSTLTPCVSFSHDAQSKPSRPYELVEAAQAEHDVVAREARHLVAFSTAIQDVVAGIQRHLPVGAPMSPTITSPPVPPSIQSSPSLPMQLIIALVAEDDVVAEYRPGSRRR